DQDPALADHPCCNQVAVGIPSADLLDLACFRESLLACVERGFDQEVEEISSLGTVRLVREQSLHPAHPATADGLIALEEMRVGDLPGLVGRPTLVGCFE